MLKYFLILLAAYFLYYAGNIVYDLFLKKEKTADQENAEEFLLSDITREEDGQPLTVGIEDVENLRTPGSFLKREVHPLPFQILPEDNTHLQDLRRRFEDEQDLDDIITDSDLQEAVEEVGHRDGSAEEQVQEIESDENEPEEKDSEANEPSETESRSTPEAEAESGSTQEEETLSEQQQALQKQEEVARKEKWDNIVGLAESSIAMVKNVNGHKVIHSTI